MTQDKNTTQIPVTISTDELLDQGYPLAVAKRHPANENNVNADGTPSDAAIRGGMALAETAVDHMLSEGGVVMTPQEQVDMLSGAIPSNK